MRTDYLLKMNYATKTNKDVAYEKHIRYFKRFLTILPYNLTHLETQRMTIAFFAISGIDVLNAIETLSAEYKNHIIEWIYSLQIINNEDNVSGFQGSTSVNYLNISDDNFSYRCGFIAHTYTALASLLILGDDLSRVNKEAIIKSLRSLQLSDGNYTASLQGTESDMRFVYCAACICYIFDDWSGMDIEKSVKYILNSMSYDFGIGQGPELESHGGSTFCAVATLILMNQIHRFSDHQLNGLKRWLLFRQEDGFHGRPNKPVDTCYSFWVGAALKMLNIFDLTNKEKNREYIMSTQDTLIGGFSKWVDTASDPLHAYFGICGLSLLNEKGLNEVMPSLNISMRAYIHLKSLHRQWKSM